MKTPIGNSLHPLFIFFLLLQFIAGYELPAQTAIIFSDDFNAGALDGNKWLKGTNAGNQSAVISNRLELRSPSFASGWVITRNSYQAKNSTISFKVAQPGNDGAIGMTPTYTLSSPLGIFNENNWYRFYAYRSGGSGPYLLFAQWKKNGVESGVDVTGGLAITGAVYLRLRCDNTHIHFEASLDGANWTDTYSEVFGLPGYTVNSSFYYELAAYDTPSKGVMTIDDFSIASASTTPDTQPPVISVVAAQNLTTTGAQIVWQTDEAADSQVEYGLTTGYGSTTILSSTLLTAHAVALTGLQSNKIYHYRVKSRDAAGNLATGNDFTLTTALTGDVTPPVISNVAANNPTAATATINWSTNEISDSQVEYGLTTNYGSVTTLGSTLLTNHTVTLAGLQANTIYHYRVKSKDAAGNLATSGDFTFTTGNLPGAGPGLPNLSYPTSEVFTIISRIDSTKGAPRSHGSVSMHKGFLAVIYSADGIYSDGGFSFYNISNPYAPVLVHRKDDAETDQLREAHGYGYSSSYPGDYVALQAAYGVQIWDWTNITNPIRLSYLQLPGIQDSDYALGAWWLCWQAPYIYVGGSSNGIYIVDATDAANPVLVNRGAGKPNPIPISQTGGFRLGPIFAIGNLLVASSMEGEGYLTMDISDPKNPVVLATKNLGMPNIYSIMVNGNKILSAGNGASGTIDTGYLHVHNISDPSRIDLLNEIFMGGRRGYITFQDGFVHMGGGQQYTKIDIRNDAAYSIVGTATSNIVNRSEDFATPLGNLVMVSDDHGNGSFIIPHQAAPDHTGPQVNMVSPPNNAVNQAFTTRVGLTFTDMIDLRSVNNSTFIVRPLGGAPLNGKYSTQTGIVNFFPNAPLQENTVYEIVVPQGGIKDWSGNPTPTTFSSRFTTTTYNNVPLECELLSHAPALVGENITFATRITRIIGTPKYSYDFGDGTPATPFVADSLANHIYAQPGHYTVTVTVMDSLATSHCSGAQTIHYPVSAALPTASSPIILDNALNLVWNVNPDHGTVSAIDALSLTKRFERTVGKEPRTLAQAPDGHIWVVNQADATISVLDRSTGNLITTIALPYASRPFGVAFSPDGAAGYVTLQAAGRLLKINPATRSIIGDLEVGPTPKGIAISGNSARILVTRFISPSAHGEVTEIDAANFSVTRRYDLALDPGPDTEGSGRGVPNYISAITISPDGRRAWVPSKKDNTSRGQLRDGLPLTFENTVRTIVSQIDLLSNTEDLAARLDLNNLDMANAVQFSPLGDYAFIATQGSNSIEVFEAYHRNLVTSIENVGRAPQGMVLSGDGTKLFVHCFMSRSVAVYGVSGIIDGSNNSAPKLAEIAAVSSEVLPPLVFAGKQIFYNAKDSRMNLDGYISCASCHLDGDDDGRVWDFTDRGEGLRNTIALLGRRGAGQGRVHWSANFDEIQDFEHDIRNAFGGAGFMSNAAFNTGTRNQPLGDPKAGSSPELDALAAYVESLTEVHPSPYRNAGGFLTADGQAGQALFQQLNCAACHGGNDFTDSGSGQMHDVGTIKSSSGKRLNATLLGLDTPTLRGLWQTPPYLHDGSAATLLDVLTTGNHGSSTTLTAAQQQQLAAYLLQIDNLEPAAPPATPAVAITSPLPNASFTPAQQIVINIGTASSPAGIDRIEFYSGDVKLGEDASSPYSFNWTGATLGSHTLTARTVHSDGSKTLSVPVEINVVSFLDLTLQAEDMPIKTNGDPRPPGWVLWENGYLAQTVNFSSSGLYQFTLRALGILAAGEWSQAELRINQVPQAVINVNASVYTDFTVEFNVTAGTHEVAIAFINDLYNPPDNRNLYVDWLQIQSSGSGPPDTQPPIISNVAANNLTTSAATIAWTTDEASDAQVEYGLTTSYGNSTTLNTSLVTSHSVSLSGLNANTIYHYRVKSKDAAGNLATSADFTFSTANASVLTLLSPNGGEWWIAGANQQITWSGPGAITNVKLEFSRNNGAAWRTIIANTPNTGAYSWPAPDTVSNTCLLRISDAANPSAADVSNGTFFLTLNALVNFTPSPGAPLLNPGAAGSWDENIRERGWFMYENGAYHVWYGGWKGPYNRSIPQLVKLGYAYSTDGVNWTKSAANPIHSQHWTEDIVVVKDGNTYYLYAEDEYTGDGDGAFIDLYTSTDKINWTRYGTVLSPSGNGWEESDVGTPTVWKEGNTWYMLYEGLRSGIAGQVGLATSSDGKNWTRYAGNPVLSHPFNANLDIATDSILKINGVYYVYGHYDAGNLNWVGGLFTSTNLTAWTAYSGNPVGPNSPVIVDTGANYKLYGLASNALAPYYRYVSSTANDVTPPVLSSVAATNVTISSATINWTTDEASDSQVEYGLTTSYGSSTTLNTSLVISHSAALAGLSANTTYHYRVKSKDAAGNLATSGDFTFTTGAPDVTPPVISSVAATNVTISAATVTWTTNEASDSQVEYGLTTSYGSSTTLNASLVISHSVSLSGLNANTLYHYRVKSKDAAGNLATSADFTFTTGAPDVTPPVISSVAATNVTISSATITWSTNEASDSQVEYGLTTSYGSSTTLNTSLVISHSAALAGLQQNTTYHYRVKSKDAAGNLATSADFTFTTLSVPSFDVTLQAETMPIKTNGDLRTPGWVLFEDGYVAENLTFPGTGTYDFTLRAFGKLVNGEWSKAEIRIDQVAKATITVNTSVYADFPASFTVTAGTHEVAVAFINDFFEPPLDRNLYIDWLRVKSNAPADTQPPLISSVAATNVTISSATINWTTDEASDSQVEYGLTTSYGNSTTLNTSLVTSHSAALAGLSANTTYHYRVKSKDAAGNLATSGDFTFITTADVTPPVISSVTATNVTISSATIVWTTDEASDSQVEYGLTTSYGSSTALNTSLVISHSASLAGLSANTTYHYRVKSKDAAGNLATSADFTFTTSAPDVTPPVISSVAATNVTTSAATINWTTDEASDSQVEYGLTTSYGSSTTLNTSLVISHSAALAGLQQNTTYHYRVKSKDAAGNLATSGDFTFTTLSVPSFDVTLQAETMPIKTNGDLRTPGWVLFEDGYVAEDLTFPGTGTYDFTLRAFGKLVNGEWSIAEIRIDQVTKATITVNTSVYADFPASFTVTAGTHEVAVAFINDFFEPPLDRNLYIDWLRVKSAGPADTQPPLISSVAATNVTISSATINWTTDEASDSQVEYGLTTSYGNSTTLNTSLVISHSASLAGLQANTTYHYRVKSKDAAGNLATSGDFTFTTGAPDVTPPVISSVAATNVTISAATVTWTTNEASDSQVEYGLTTSYGSSTTLNASLVISHSASLAGLQANTTYHYRVKSKDAAGNLATSADFTFTTSAPDVTPPVISSVAATNVTTSAATINWTTDEASDSQVEYGLTTSYGSSTTLNTSLVISHSAALAGLQQNTTYHYRVKSKDAAGNLATSGDFTFTTLSAPSFDVTLQAENMPIKTNGDLRTPGWVLFEDGYVAENLTFPGTGTYDFTLRAFGKLVNGEWSKAEIRIDQVTKATITVNTSVYADFPASFTVTAGTHEVAVAFINDFFEPPLDRNLYIDWLRVKSAGPADTQPPLISSVAATNVTISSATITWTTDEASDSQVEYGLTTSYGSSTTLNTSLVTSHSASLAGLSANTTYHYRVKSKDAAGNLATSGDFTFITTADVTPPVISSVAATNVTTSAATINWTTDEASDSQVEYGLTTSYGSSTTLNTSLVISHSASLAGLQQNTTYHYRVKSKDAAGNLATSGDFTFTTGAPDVTPPVISSVTATNVTISSATINWTTDEASDSQVEYGLTTSYGSSTTLNTSLVISHSAALAGLQTNTTYHYRVKSKDAAGNLATSGDFTFTTAPAPQNFDVTLQAENMPIKTNGDARPPGWVLFEDGYLAQNVNFPGGGLHQFTLRAFGKYAAGDWSQAELRIDQVARAVISVNVVAYTDFTAEFTVAAGTHEVAVAFINDYYNPPDDRNLYVDWLRIQADGTDPSDTQPPVISGVTANSVAAVTATIVWTTDEASDSQAEYGLTASYGNSTTLNTSLVTSHAVSLAGLQANTTYHYRVNSKDAAGNLATSGDFTFTTTSGLAGSVAFANVQDLFTNNCVRCHQGATAPAGLVLLPGQAHGNIVNVPSTEYPQWQRVQPGSRATSWLYEKISNPTPAVGSKMGGLSADEIELIGSWIDQGANEVPVPPYANLQFRTTTLGNGEINIAYFSNIVVWGGLPPYQLNVVSGALPDGLVLDSNSGLLVGTPNTVGSYDFTVRMSDSQTPAATLDQIFHIEIFNTQDHWQLPPGFVIENVVSDLHLPVNIAFVPNPGLNPTDPYFYVTLLYGDIIMVQRNFQKNTYATGLLNFVPTGAFPGSGEMGVTGIAVDPVSGDVFASMVYEETPGSEDFRGKVVRFLSTDGGRTAATQTTILSGFASAISHQIQEVTIGTDGKVYVNTGDGWVSEAAPDINDRRGKVLRMNLDGSVPADNPFPNNVVFATGFRNPFGAAWRQADGKLYVSDNGQDTDDRVAKVIAGDDYGWGLLSQDLTKGAIFLWNPTVAPVAMDFLHNNSFPSHYYGNLFVGLSGPPYLFGPTPRGKKIQRFGLDPNGQVVSDSVFLDYIGAGAATVIGVAFGDDGLYFTDLYGENGFDEFGQTHGNIYRIRSTAAPDTTRPAISNVQTTNITGTSATIVWQTDEAATRQVEYGLTTSYGLSTPLQSTLATSHSVTLGQLTPETMYHFRVLSADAVNNSSVSSDFTFTTIAVDATPPVISAVQVDSITVAGAAVKWTTNEPASSFVDFGLTNAYGTTVSNAAFATSHRVVLSGLADSTLYHFRVRSLDASGNATSSSDSAFTTRHNYNVSLDVTLEAENMPIKTNGDARPPGWALFENGYIAENVSFPATGVYQFTLRARGIEAAGEWSMAELRIDQVPRATLNIDNEDYTDFNTSFTVAAGTHEVAIAFINDIYEPPLNRNLYVDWLRLQNTSTGSGAVKAAAAASTPSAPPEKFMLQNYPNPFNAATKIRFALPRAAEVEVKVFDVAGHELSELANGERAAGNHEVIWNGRGRNGRELGSGVYLVRLRYRTERHGAWSQLLQRIMLVK